MSLLSSPRGYVQVFRNKLVIQLPSEGRTVVKEAAFSHPRLLVGNFELAERTLMEGMKEAWPSRLLAPRPQVIMHPREVLEGGYTMIEQRVLQEMALGAGARQVKVWLREELDKAAVEGFVFS